MKKSEALSRVSGAAELDRANTRFASINAATDIWWLEVPLAMLDSEGATEINLLLFDHRTDELHHLRVPTDYLRANLGSFTIRVDKKSIDLGLVTDPPSRFENVKPIDSGVSFAQFLVRTA